MAPNFQEKRRFPRINLHVPISYQIRGKCHQEKSIYDDISEGGISFLSDVFIAPETTLNIEIDILCRIIKPIGKVIWSSPLPHSDRKKLGVQFLELDFNERRYLVDYINMQISQI